MRMNSKKLVATAALVFTLAMLGGCSNPSEMSSTESQIGTIAQYDKTDVAMGTVINETVYTKGKNHTDTYIKKLKELEDDLISWRIKDSEIGKINSSAGDEKGVTVSDDTASYLKQTLDISQKSHGALDPTIGKITRLWGIDSPNAKAKIPDQKELDKLREEIGYQKVKIEGNQVILPQDVSLDLGAVGKGLGCDVLKDTLAKDKNVKGAVIAVGGSVLVYGSKESKEPWTVAVADPRGEEGSYMGAISVSDQEKYISTSGDYEKYFIKDGKRYHHIIDPSTGYPADSGLISITVVCDNGLLSDGLSTACFILGKDKGAELLKEYGAEGVFIDKNKKVYVTDGLKDQFQIVNDKYKLAD